MIKKIWHSILNEFEKSKEVKQEECAILETPEIQESPEADIERLKSLEVVNEVDHSIDFSIN